MLEAMVAHDFQQNPKTRSAGERTPDLLIFSAVPTGFMYKLLFRMISERNKAVRWELCKQSEKKVNYLNHLGETVLWV